MSQPLLHTNKLELPGFAASAQQLGATRVKLASHWFIGLVSLTLASAYNLPLWHHLATRLDGFNLKSLSFCIALLLLQAGILALLLNFFNHRLTLKFIAGMLIAAAGFMAYFNGLGVIIDKNMLVNILQTDAKEASELFNTKLAVHTFLFVVAPLIFVARIKLTFPRTFSRSLATWMVPATLLTLSLLLVYGNFKYTTFFGRENNDLKGYLNPTYALLESYSLVKDALAEEPPFQTLGLDATQHKLSHKKTVGIFIVGETARADHFSINGYDKTTSPELASQPDLYNFANVTSCGTSTAYSIPCMFSFLTGAQYSPNVAKHQSNVLDILNTAGIRTVWRDNNSDCKGVCLRAEYQNFRDHIQADSPFYNHGEYVDEVLLTNLDKLIAESDQDTLIVLHQLGSHGPAYYKRYPERFAKFKPECDSDSPQLCSFEEVNNSYDNTILYTDHVINTTIEYLKSKQSEFQSFVFYASDHGESLGELGIYLHGLPKSIAPVEQRHVPMMLWLSNNNDQNTGKVRGTLASCEASAISHDVISQSLLALFNVESSVNDTELNLLNHTCQQQVASSL